MTTNKIRFSNINYKIYANTQIVTSEIH